MANASFRSAASNVDFGVTSITVNKPSGTVSTDGLFAIIVLASTGTPPTVSSAPSGWTQKQTFTQAMFGLNLRFYIYEEFAGGSEPSNYTWNASGTCDVMTGDIVTLQDVLDSTWFQTISTQTYNSNNTPQAASVTTDKTNQTIVWFFYHGFGTGITGTVPSGFSEVYDTDPLCIGTRVLTSPGSTGTATGGMSTSEEWVCWQLGVYGEDSVTPGSGGKPDQYYRMMRG